MFSHGEWDQPRRTWRGQDSQFPIPILALELFPPHLASGAFLLHSRGNTRVEEACEMYTRAANMFKIAKNWSGESKSWDLGGCG